MYGSLDRAKSRSSTNMVDVQAQLEESEKRRSLLVEKLSDAKDTIQVIKCHVIYCKST